MVRIIFFLIRHTYPLSNLFGQLIIAQQNNKFSFTAKFPSAFILKNLEILESLGFIKGFQLVKTRMESRVIVSSVIIFLRYSQHGQPAVTFFRLYSSPGRRLHLASYHLEGSFYRHRSKSFIVSTSSGLQVYTGFFSKTFFYNKAAGVLLYTIA